MPKHVEAGDRVVRVEVVTTAVQPSRPDLLAAPDRARWQELRRAVDRDRLSTGALLRQAVLREQAGRAVPVVRRCGGCGATDHGAVQPAAPQDRARWRTSISHAGDVVALAVAHVEGVEAEVGLDVEVVDRTDPCIVPLVMGDVEQSRLPAPTRWDLCGVWTAKEAVLKALGCGLHVAMTELEIRPRAGDEPGWDVRAVGGDHRLQPLREQPCRVDDLTSIVADGQRAALAVTGVGQVHLDHCAVTTARWHSWVGSLLGDGST